MTIMKPNPSIGVVFACTDRYGGALTVQIPSPTNPGPAGVCGIAVSDPNSQPGAMITLEDEADRVALARALRVLSRPASTERAPDTEVEAMAAFAEELENFGYKGCFLSDEVIRMTLAANSTVDGMKSYVEGAFQASQKREGEA